MDMNTIALIKGLAGNGGGSSLPTNPAQDGTYALQNTVSSGTSTLSWESGSSGGGVLVVHNVEGTLDKTWQEIHDAMKSVGAVYDGGDDDGVYVIASTYIDTNYFVACSAGEWVASSASGYPALFG